MKYAGAAGLLLLALGITAHVRWKYSGSDRWELVRQKEGVTLYAMKTPGSTLKKFKAVRRVRSTLTAAMALSQDPGVCEYTKCYDGAMFEKVDDQLQYYIFKWTFPLPFHPREFVISQRFSRVPEAKALLVEVVATPDKMPPNNCCVRITDMHNTWRFTPLSNGEIEIEYVYDMALGGAMPYVLANVAGPQFMLVILSQMQMVLDKEREKFPNLKFALLQGE
jgi:START domain